MSKQCTNYIGTYNNPEVDVKEYLEKWNTHGKAVYVVGQLEKGQEGTPHIQFFLNFKKPGITIAGLKKFCSKAHFEQVRVNNGADLYCMKEETRLEGPFEYGIKPVKRNDKQDWEEVKQKAQAGQLDKIPAEIYVKHYTQLRQIAKDHQVNINRDSPRKCLWLWGKAGAGKTRRAVQLYPDAYMKLSNKWWDGYQGQEAVVLDDLDPKIAACLVQHLKHWSDPWGKMPGEVKGGQIPLTYNVFIVTSQYSIQETFPDQKDYDAISRRFQEEEVKISYQTTNEGVFNH